jgi:hypothetical protein
MKTKIVVMFSIMAILGAGLFALDLTGTDIAKSGTLGTISGVLKSDGSEWMLETSAKKLYNVHFGNYTLVYPEGLGLKEGNEATITGFMLNDDIAVSQIKTDGATYTLRDETTGRPAWAGMGNRKNEKDEKSNNNEVQRMNKFSNRKSGGKGQKNSSSDRLRNGKV